MTSGPDFTPGGDWHSIEGLRRTAHYQPPWWRLVVVWLRWRWQQLRHPDRHQLVLCHCGGWHRHDGSWHVYCPILLRRYTWAQLPDQEAPR